VEGKIIFGKREAISLLIILICNQLILGFPSIMSNSVEVQDGFCQSMYPYLHYAFF